MSSLYSVVLREEVFRKFASFSDVDSLRSYCNAFEAAHKDASMGYSGKGSVAHEGTMAAATDPLPDVGDSGWVPEAAATNTCHLDKPRKCGNCGRTHLPKKSACPAEKLVCHNCSKTGHLAVMCRWRKQAAAAEDVEASGTVVVATGKVMPQPSIAVTVHYAHRSSKLICTQVVPDTGAQMCVAGLKLMGALDIPHSLLKRQGSRHDVANMLLQPLGSATCSMQYCGRSTTQEVFFVESASRFYISLEACKQLGLVHSDFPHQPPTAAIVTRDSNSNRPTPADNIPPRPA